MTAFARNSAFAFPYFLNFFALCTLLLPLLQSQFLKVDVRAVEDGTMRACSGTFEFQEVGELALIDAIVW